MTVPCSADENRLMDHTETLVKVNAWVDEGVAPLVRALNQFDDAITLDSCEGHQGESAYVHFCSRAGVEELCSLVHRLSSFLGRRLPANDEYRLTIEWVAGGTEPLATLEVHQGFIQPLADAVDEAVANVAPRIASACDT